MDNYNQDQGYADFTVVGSSVKPVSRAFMANVFLWMFAALGISTLFAFLFATTPSLMSLLFDPTTGKQTGIGMVVMIAPIIFVLIMGMRVNKLSAGAMIALFIAFAAIMGISLSYVLLIYTSGSVIGCFASASAMFGIMAVMGYTTDKDLTSFGSILRMGVYGIFIAMLINMFLGSARMDYVISILGVAIFTGLTAYDVQKLKRVGAGIEYDGVNANDTKKISILGALTLYLDFINLFLFMLRLFGGRRRN